MLFLYIPYVAFASLIHPIYSLVAGNSKSPSAKTLQLLSEALGVSVEFLLLDDEEYSFVTLNQSQLKLFHESTSATINMIIERDLNFSFDNLTKVIKSVYEYSLKKKFVDTEFIDYVVDKYKNN
jgi:transcriptional regulator with XRE-family HTH domain